MEWALFFKAVLSLAFVLGLLLLTLWAIKYLEVNSVKCRLFKKLADQRRLNVLETKRLDAKNSLVLVKCDDKEYLLLLGNSNVVIGSEKIAKSSKSKGDNNEK